MFDSLLRKMELHPLGAAEFGVVREVLKRDDHFRLSHLSPLVMSYFSTRRRREWIAKAQADVDAVPEDWHRRTPPIFVLGFWRSGTTLLHELMVTDPAFAAPSLIDVLCPSDAPYLLRWKRDLVGRMTPITRGIDKVEVEPNSPQEEELALCNMGAPSFFGVSFFPRRRAEGIDEALFFEDLPEARARWRDAHMRFSRMLVAKYPDRRLVLKNPANCTRIPDLLEMYPDALFLRIDRRREQVISSFLKMQAQGDRKFSFQGRPGPPQREDAERFHARVMAKFDADWASIPAERRTQITYDGLLKNPLKLARLIYQALGIELTRDAAKRRKAYWVTQARPRTPPGAIPARKSEVKEIERASAA